MFIFYVILVVAGIYFLVGLMLYLLQERMVFQPFGVITETPEQIALEFENLIIDTDDGEKVHAWFVPGLNAKCTVLFCHGNAGNLSHRLDTVKVFNDLGINFCVFDYRGYGSSTGTCSEEGLYKDSEAVWKYLVEEREIPSDRILIDGRSLGGAVAARLAGKVNPAGLILESAFASIPDMAPKMSMFYPVEKLTRIKMPTANYVQDVKCPVLILHSSEDEVVHYDHSKILYEHAPEPKNMVDLAGDHNNCYFISEPDYKKAIREFINSIPSIPA